MRAGLALALLLCATAAFAIEPPSRSAPPGMLRIAGNPQLREAVDAWVRVFAEQRSDIRVDVALHGSDIGFAALYTGNADIALLGRDATDPEAKAYEWVFLEKPAAIDVLHGSLDRAGRSPAPVVFVHADNPLRGIDLSLLEAVLGAEHRQGRVNARTWGDLGLDGAWRDAPIALYLPNAESGSGRYLRAAVLGGSLRMAWERMREFDEPVLPQGRIDDAGPRALAALQDDRHGLAIAHLAPDTPKTVKPLPLARNGDETPVPAARDTLRDGRYPLVRRVRAYVHRRSDAPLDPNVAAFLAFALSDAGQAAITAGHGYLPLGNAAAGQQREVLATWK